MKSIRNKMKLPKIKTIKDFADPVGYCFYMLGYTEGVRGDVTVEPEPQYKTDYDKGLRDGESFASWLLSAAINNKN